MQGIIARKFLTPVQILQRVQLKSDLGFPLCPTMLKNDTRLQVNQIMLQTNLILHLMFDMKSPLIEPQINQTQKLEEMESIEFVRWHIESLNNMLENLQWKTTWCFELQKRKLHGVVRNCQNS